MEAEQIDSDWFKYKCIKTGQILSLYNRTTGEYKCGCFDKNKKKLAKICELLHSNKACKFCDVGSQDNVDSDHGVCTIMYAENNLNHQMSYQTREIETEKEGEDLDSPNEELDKSNKESSIPSNLEKVLPVKSKSKTNEETLNNLVETPNQEDQTVENSEMNTDDTALQFEEMSSENDNQSNAYPTRRLTKRELKNKLKCTFCKKTFPFLSRLNTHLRTHTREKPFKCTYCDKTFGQKSAKVRHTKLHTEEKPFKCEYCKMAFPVERRLKKHLKKHVEFRPYKCTFCEKAFKKRSDFLTHTRIHTGERPFHCTHRCCYKSFKQKGALESHLAIHTDERPHECVFCDKAFRQEHHLIVHLRRHTGEKPYKCTLCDKTFRHESSLKEHLKSRMHASKD